LKSASGAAGAEVAAPELLDEFPAPWTTRSPRPTRVSRVTLTPLTRDLESQEVVEIVLPLYDTPPSVGAERPVAVGAGRLMMHRDN
jgi:hypothetical protein